MNFQLFEARVSALGSQRSSDRFTQMTGLSHLTVVHAVLPKHLVDSFFGEPKLFCRLS